MSGGLQFVELLLTLYGPLAMGWVSAAALMFMLWRMYAKHQAHIHERDMAHRVEMREITAMVTSALTENAKANSELATRLQDLILRRNG